MIGPVLGPWSAFFSTAAQSAATLAGLVMVAISVNVQRIIALKHLPARAAAAIGSLVLVLVISLAALIPQPPTAFAVEAGVTAVIAWIMHLRTVRMIFVGHAELGRPLYERYLLLAFGQTQILPLSVGAVLFGLGYPGGLYWIAGTALAAFIVAAVNAWVLLVEILR